MSSVLVLTHAVMVDGRSMFGSAHNVVEHLVARGDAVRFVQHSMQPGEPNVVADLGRGAARERRIRYLAERPPFRYLPELLRNLRELATGRHDLAVVVDPLNYASVLVARALLPSARRRVPTAYYTVDYADQRFASPWMNRIYHLLDRLALRDADQVWGVSRAIMDLRRSQGVPDDKAFLMPNTPPFEPARVLARADRDPGSLIVMGNFEGAIDAELIVACLVRLVPRVPGVRVYLAGRGSGIDTILERARREGVEGAVEHLGFLQHGEALARAGRCLIGWAPYTPAQAWHAYSDSLKIREYAALGLPIVTTPGHALADDLVAEDAGIVAQGVDATAAALEKLLNDGERWEEAAGRARAFAERYDRGAVVERALATLGSRP